jgi:hypothetical protein
MNQILSEEENQESPQTEQENAGAQMPDPAYLLSYVALQMETKDLVAALSTIFDGHAWRALGLVADPRTGAVQQDLPTAQLAIDCVQFLLGKVESDMTEPERRDAQRRLNDLRVNYLGKVREQQ